MQLKNHIRWAMARYLPLRCIVQFSPPRSGSTLVYNILREVFPQVDIRKKHNYKDRYNRYPVVATYRHPLDCVASLIQRYATTPTDDVLEQQLAEFQAQGVQDLLDIRTNPNVLLLRYEEFVDDFTYLYPRLEQFFGIEIPEKTRQMIKAKYAIEQVQAQISDKQSFAEYDPVTQWHGNHISKFKGQPYYYREFFRPDQIAHLQHVFGDYLTAFGYE